MLWSGDIPKVAIYYALKWGRATICEIYNQTSENQY